MSVSRTVAERFSYKKCCDLETGGRGRSRSLKMAQYDRSYRQTHRQTPHDGIGHAYA